MINHGQWQQIQAINNAEYVYIRSYVVGALRRMWAAVRGRPHNQPDLATLQPRHTLRTQDQLPVLQAVPIRSIRGSVGANAAYDATFAPRTFRNRTGWLRLAVAVQLGEEVPPVKLIKVNDAYFVHDGHIRLSVARAFGQEFIDAVVTVWHVDTPQAADRPSAVRTASGQRGMAT